MHTRRLVARCWQPLDAPLLKTALDASRAHLRPWMPWVQQEPEALAIKVERLRRYRGEFDLGHDFTYGLFDREESRVIGGSGLHTRQGADAREIGYWIHVDFINQGLATEVTAALTKVAFVIDRVTRVEVRCDPRNTRSFAVPRKLGFRHQATVRQQTRGPDGASRDTMIWTLLAGDYPASPAAAAEIEAFNVTGSRLL